MTAIKHDIKIDKGFVDNELLYYFDFSDYVRFTDENYNLYKKNTNLLLLNVGQQYNFLNKVKHYKYSYSNLHVVNIQVALGLVNTYINTSDSRYLDRALKISEQLVKDYAEITDNRLYLWHDYYQPSYMLKPKWLSGMAQGEFCSLSLRLYSITSDDRFLTLANKSMRVMLAPVEKGGTSICKNGYLWFEEYVNVNYPNYVLNGNVFSILAIFDYIRILNDDQMKATLELTLNALRLELPKFTRDHFSFYDLRKTMADTSYNDLHAKQMAVLFLLTNDNTFLEFSQKFQSLNYDNAKLSYFEKFENNFLKVRKLLNYLYAG